MSGITKILTRTPGELGSIKTNKSPIVEENKQLPAEQWNTAADAIIEIQTVIGEAANPAAGTIMDVLNDHEERIDELEQNGGGGSSDRIESESGAAFAEATDDFLGMGTSATLSRTNHSSGSAFAYTAIAPGEGGPESQVLLANVAVANADETQSAGIGAQYDPTADEFTLTATGAPLTIEGPTKSNHAATKGYVDARPGAEEWAEYPATQDVDMDGYKLTGLGEPTDAADAATKGYVDGAAPAKIELAGSRVEVLPNGNIEIWRDGQLRLRIGNTNFDPSITLSTKGASGTEILSGGSMAELRAGSRTIIGVERWNGGRVYLYSGAAQYFLAVNGDALPAGVESVVQAARRAYERRADLEWWDPTWTAIENVDSVSNVECQYTRTYRAAGGSLVTLEGTIEVTPEAGGARSTASVSLPIPRVGTDIIGGVASFTDYDGDDFGIARVGIADLGAGQQLTVQYTPDTDAVHRVSFRLSYRAA